jgi:succinate dehydrogenase/fumarate reductase flavoprotein subunit
MAALASLERRESRWSLMHRRIDYPERDDLNWLEHPDQRSHRLLLLLVSYQR